MTEKLTWPTLVLWLFIGVGSDMKTKSFILITLLATCYLLLAEPAVGAELYFGAHSKDVGVRESFEVGVFVSTQGELINAIEGKVIFPPDMELVEIRDGNSILNLWIKRPQLKEAGQVSFAGVIPGGYFGDRGYLFSLILRAKREGLITITTSDERILLNDGQASPTDVKRAPLSVNVSEGVTAEEFSPPLDSDPPEPFTPIVVRNPDVFENKYFLVFATQDKGSGIKEYQVQERKFFKKPKKQKWITVESPYLLKDQGLRSYVFAKAIDNAGNERLATLFPQTSWYKDYTVWSIIVLSILLSYAFLRLSLWKTIVSRSRDHAQKRRGTKTRK
jgi:hypothetical protein